MIAVDTNILVYARRAEMPMHTLASRALTELAEGDSPWAVPVPCAVEFIRVVTHRRLFDPPTDRRSALRYIDGLLESPTARLLAPGDRFWSLFSQLIAEGGMDGNLAFDAQIAAICLEHGVADILTEDRDFLRFKRMRVRTLA